MNLDNSKKTASYKLPLPPSEASRAETPVRVVEKHLPAFLLAQNACWFCRFRWIVIGILTTFGILGFSDGFVAFFGLHPPGIWPFVTAGILTLGNLVFCSRYMSSSPRAVYNLWMQIIMDLIVLTVVVHFVGCLETNISIIYLFHIVLACIFFSHKQSLAVTLLACVMFSACITAELTEIIPSTTIFAEPLFNRSQVPSAGIFVLDFLSVIVIWLVVWYLTSHLSAMVRKRDRELAETNRRLVAAQEERSQHMRTTTHQLKSPFAAIHTNAELLLKGHCGPLTDEAVEVVRRISARSRRLATEIQEMLLLANLSSARKKTSDWEKVDLAQVMRWSIEQIQPLSLERGVEIDAHLESASYIGEGEYLKMLFSNLLANAVNYSYMGGKVSVNCKINKDSKPVVTISDEGIGIPAEKLPLIFNEYYRTTKAVRHNKESSGLGLAIVSQAVKLHGIRLRVESQPEAGTTFELRF